MFQPIRGAHDCKMLLEVRGSLYYLKKPNAHLQRQQIVKWKLTSREEDKSLSDMSCSPGFF